LIEGLDLFEDVAACVAKGLLDYVVGEVPEEVAFNVCFVEDAPRDDAGVISLLFAIPFQGASRGTITWDKKTRK